MKNLFTTGLFLAMLSLFVPVPAHAVEQNCSMVIEFRDNRTPLSIPTEQIRNITFRPTNESTPGKTTSSSPASTTKTGQQPVQTSPFDGKWHVQRTHSKCCAFTATEDWIVSTDANGVTSVAAQAFPGKGKVGGKTFSFSYGPGCTVSVTLSADGKSFTGTFSDNQGHRGSMLGKR